MSSYPSAIKFLPKAEISRKLPTNLEYEHQPLTFSHETGSLNIQNSHVKTGKILHPKYPKYGMFKYLPISENQPSMF